MKHPAKLSVDISFEIGTYICFFEQFFIEVFGLCMGVTTNFGAIKRRYTLSCMIFVIRLIVVTTYTVYS